MLGTWGQRIVNSGVFNPLPVQSDVNCPGASAPVDGLFVASASPPFFPSVTTPLLI